MALALALAIAMGYGTRYDENEQTQRLKRGVCVSKRGLLVQGLRSTSSVSEVGRVRVGFGFVFGLCWCILRIDDHARESLGTSWHTIDLHQCISKR
jgi:hypothetical protein